MYNLHYLSTCIKIDDALARGSDKVTNSKS